MRLTSLSPRRVLGIAAACACAALITPAVALAATAAPAASAPACTTSGLVIWMNTQGGAAAGSIYYTLKFTNLSGHTCTLDGHPGVSAVGLTSKQIGAPAGWEPPAIKPVTLANDATATALLQYSDVVTSNNQCKTEAAGLRVYPPNQTASKIIPFPLTVCSKTSLVYMHVEPVTS